MNRISIAGIILFTLIGTHLRAQLAASCAPATARVDLDINNVRTMIMNGGDMWWDLSNPHYEIPKGSNKNSIYCGALWMGGMDPAGQLHVAAMTYRQDGNDFWPGPLDTINGGIIDSTCNVYDRLWKLNRSEVSSFIANHNDPNYVVPQDILSWPAHGNTERGQSRWLAPFTDVDGDLVYNPEAGDYPAFNFSGQNNCDQDLLGDQAIWWVFNDKGNTHSETGGAALGFEIQAMAFAYRSSNDALNDATFYRYRVINRSTLAYDQLWFSQWLDYDVGDAFDDLVGCDVARGLGYGYNGDINDGQSATPGGGTYGEHPPAVGIDYLSGPNADLNDGVDNDRDSIIDEADERIALASSMYYEGDFSVRGNPSSAPEFYTFLQHRWKDNTPLTYGGNGYGGPYPCQFMYPGDSDPIGWGTYGVPLAPWWDLYPFDRRQLNAVGPFSMNPGEVEVITVGIPWARDMNGDNLDAIDRLKEADDYIQQLFDNCFAIPCVDLAQPEITFTVTDHLAYFNLLADGTAWAWDFGDGKHSTQQHPSHYYPAAGDYVVCVNVTTACGVFSDCDTVHIADQLSHCGPRIWRIEGTGNGKQELAFTNETIERILSDTFFAFPEYAELHGPVKISYEDFEALQEGEYRIAFDSVQNTAGWKMWMVGGTDTVYSDSTISSGAIQRIAMWGLGVQITQVPKIGNGLNPDRNGYLASSVSFADESKAWLSGIADTEFDDQSNWIRAGQKYGSGVCISEFNDRFIGVTPLDGNEDFEHVNNGTWAPYRLNAYVPLFTAPTQCYNNGVAWTPSPLSAALMNKIENLANVDVVITNDKSLWTRCPVIETGPFVGLNLYQREPFHLRGSYSVDKNGRNIHNGGLSDPTNPEAADFIGARGMSWFPGYAINLETGERLNMAFGENSAYTLENGRDMIWNPTENEIDPVSGALWGGCHYIYVFGHNGNDVFTNGPLINQLKDIPKYDCGRAMHRILNSDTTANAELKEVYADAMWTTIPVLTSGHTLLECDVTIQLRVQKPYARFATSTAPLNNNNPLYGFRVDHDEISCNYYTGEVNVFPNPFSTECVVQFENLDAHLASLNLYDIQGKLVRQYTGMRSDRIVISGAGLSEGLYIWTLEVEGEKPRTGKVVFR